jgi:cytochrome c peroxidase
MRPTLLLLIALPLALPLAGCGGGAADASVEAPAPDPAPDPTPVPPPPPAPPPPAPTVDAALEARLRDLAADEGAGLMLAPPVQPAALVALGRALFFDKILSGNRDISCATCHDPDAGTGDALSLSIGTGGVGKGAARRLEGGHVIPRNAPHLFRLSRQPTMFWDSRVLRRQDGTLDTPEAALDGPNPAAPQIAQQLTTALAAQAMFPVASATEMAGQPGENEIADADTNLEVWRRLMLRLVGTADDTIAGIDGYRTLFAQAYPAVANVDALNFGHAARAMAAFESDAFDTRGAPFDDWLSGNANALTNQQRRGGILFFGRADCSRCHGGPAFTDGQHHAIGVPQLGPGREANGDDLGRFAVTGANQDRYRFRTPSLRNVALTGPWMHDGAYTSLANAVRHYIDPERSLAQYDATQLSALLAGTVDLDPARQAARDDAISGIVRGGTPLNPGEVADLVAFLLALSDDEAQEVSGARPAAVPSGLPVDD